MSGAIPDPKSTFYRNSKWLRELGRIGSKTHRDIGGLLETLAQVNPAVRG